MKDKASFKKIHTQKHVPTHAYILEDVYELPINDQLPLAHESIETKRRHSIKKKKNKTQARCIQCCCQQGRALSSLPA